MIYRLHYAPDNASFIIRLALDELGVPFETVLVDRSSKGQRSAAYLALNPAGRIPTLETPGGPISETGAILIYLGEKTGKLIGSSAREKAEILQWLMFQMGGVGPMFGQLGFFYKFAGKDIEDPRPQERYVNEAKRLLNVVETALEGRDWIAGDYSIADIALAPWLRALDFYGAREVTGWADHPRTVAYLDRFLDRPAVQVGLVTPPRD